MMLRKVGGLGKLARKSNLMGITNMFNKDKDRGDEDKFGAIGGEDDSGAKGSKKKGKKASTGSAASPSISHATAESDGGNASSSQQMESGMTPAAYYVRQMQEAEARAEAAAKAARDAEAARSAAKGNKTTDDVQGDRQKMIEKEKARLKSKRAGGWRKRIGMGSSSDAKELTGLETTPVSDDLQDEEQDEGKSYTHYAATAVGPPPPSAYANAANDTAFDAAFDDEELEPPHLPAGSGAGAGTVDYSSDEFETDSLRHWGEGIEKSRASAARIAAPRGILKRNLTASAAAEVDKPWTRTRANSYDAPNGSAAGAPLMSQMSNTIGGANRMDGVARPASPMTTAGVGVRVASPTLRPAHQRSETVQGLVTPASGASSPAGGANSTSSPLSIGHHANSSMPTLSLMTDADLRAASPQQRSATGPPQRRKRLTFAETHIFHSTWPAHVYDRRGESATCNRLTPLLAQRIKEVSQHASFLSTRTLRLTTFSFRRNSIHSRWRRCRWHPHRGSTRTSLCSACLRSWTISEAALTAPLSSLFAATTCRISRHCSHLFSFDIGPIHSMRASAAQHLIFSRPNSLLFSDSK